jgi:hypothetical protein
MISLDFKQFLEARGQIATPGAFGRFGTPKNRYNMPKPFDDSADYNSRIAAGKKIETQIIEKLNKLGYISKPTTAREDMYDGIDGWFIQIDGQKVNIPYQIKARKGSSGNDILWETIKPWNPKLIQQAEELGDRLYTGKDMKCKAELLVSTSNDGNIIRLRSVPETIKKSKELVGMLILNFRSLGKPFAKTSYGETKLVTDPSQQANFSMSGKVSKVVCFLNPDAYQWKKDLTTNLRSF